MISDMKESKSHNSKNFRNEWQNWGENRKFKRHFRNENSGRRNRIEWDNTLRKIENRRDRLFNTTKKRKGIREKKKTGILKTGKDNFIYDSESWRRNQRREYNNTKNCVSR